MALDATAAVIGAILGPIAGVIGSRIKVWIATRDARGRAKQLMKEAGELLEFSDKLQQSANSGGAVTRIPPQSLENLQLAVKEKIEEVTEALSPAALAQARRRKSYPGHSGPVVRRSAAARVVGLDSARGLLRLPRHHGVVCWALALRFSHPGHGPRRRPRRGRHLRRCYAHPELDGVGIQPVRPAGSATSAERPCRRTKARRVMKS